MAKSSKSRSRPSKPRSDFPLFPHASGRWAKKVRGRFAYFGKVADDPKGEKALEKWLDWKDDLLAGRKPRPKVDTLTVDDLINGWLHWKKQRMETGELSPRTWEQYKALAAIVISVFGRDRAASDPGPDDFQKLRDVFAKRWGPGALATGVIITRSIWNWGYTDGKLARPPQFGAGFTKPGAKAIRQAKTANGKGPRMFTPQQIHALLKTASPNMKAMLLLGVQAGIGNTDLALAPIDAADLETGWLTLPRAKTAIPRRIPLWAETVAAIRDVLRHRPTPKHNCEHLLFVTQKGNSYLGNRRGNPVWQEYQKAADAAGVTGRTFYDCRRTFATVADAAKDPVAVTALMGHAPRSGDMQAVYRQMVPDDRLKAVVKVVHDWLFAAEDDGTRGRKDKQGDDQVGEQGDAPAMAPIQRAICRCLAATAAADEPDKSILRSVWNESEIALALSGDSRTVQKFLEAWDGEDREKNSEEISRGVR